MKSKVTIYSRHGCHLCHVMRDEVVQIQSDFDFTIEIIYIDKNIDLEEKSEAVVHIKLARMI